MRYTIYNVIKGNSNIKGYWKDKNKVYIDNIQLIKCHDKKTLKENIKRLFNIGELAVFYKDNTKGIIESKNGDKTILNKRLEFRYKKGYGNIQDIKRLVSLYNGCTIYIKKGYIIAEVFTA